MVLVLVLPHSAYSGGWGVLRTIHVCHLVLKYSRILEI